MPPSKKQARKQKKQRDRQKRIAKSRGQSQRSVPPTPHMPELFGAIRKSESDSEPLSPIEHWWEQFENAEGQERLEMLREKLASPLDEDWREALFPEAVHELERGLADGEYVSFLEELRDDHPKLFAPGLDWHVYAMICHYIPQRRWDDVDRAAELLASQLEGIEEPLFSLLSLLRFAGRAEAVQRLLDEIMPRISDSDLMPWAVHELIDMVLFGPVQACVEAGATDEALEELFQKSLTFGVKDNKKNRALQRRHIAHIAGTSQQVWTRKGLLAADEGAEGEMFCLFYEFGRWLCRDRGYQPIVADELRRVLVKTINRMECGENALLRGLKRDDFDPALAKTLHFMSLSQFHAPAAIAAMRLLYDFLQARNLVDKRTCDTAQSVCYVLQKEVDKVIVEQWKSSRFLKGFVAQPATETG